MSLSTSRAAASFACARPLGAVRRLSCLALLALLWACGGGGGGGGGSPAPEVTITAQPADVHVTAGANASFTVGTSDSVSYEWQRLQGSSWNDVADAGGATLTLAGVATGDSGSEFRVIVASRANPANSITSSVVVLTVDPLAVAPAIVAAPVDTSVTEGLNATFSVTATGTAPAYQWQRSGDGTNWSDIGGATTTSLSLSTSLSDDGAWLRVQVSNAQGTVASAAARLHVTPLPEAPVFTTQPTGAVVVVGQAATFNAVATGVPAPGLQWMTSTDGTTWTPIAGAQGGSYTTPATTLADNGHWFRAVASNASTTDSNPVLLTVNPVPAVPVITTQPADATVQFQQTLQVVATGYPSPTYQWQISADGGASFTNINNATRPAYQYSPVSTAADGTQLRVVVSNSAGSVTSRAATMTVIGYPQVKLSPEEAVWRAGVSPVHLSATATGGQLHYSWHLQVGAGAPSVDVPAGTDAPDFDLPADAPGYTRAVCVDVTNAAGSASSCTLVTALRWTAIAPLPTMETLRTVAWVDASTVLAGGAVGTLLRSTDGGTSWTEVFNDGYVGALTRGLVVRGSLALAVGEQGFDARSTNAGQDWSYVRTLDNTFWNAVAFTDAGVAIKVGGISGAVVRTSSDQGLTWQDASVPAGDEVLAALAVNHAGVALAAGLNGVVLRSTDGGLTWSDVHIGLHNLNALAFASDSVVVAAGDYGVAWRSADAGLTWAQASSPTPYAISDVHFASATLGVASTLQGPLLRTTDGGQTWVLANNDPGNASFSARFGPDGNTVMAVGATGRILRSTDAGLSYANAIPPVTASSQLVGVASNGAGIGLAAGDAGVRRTTDGGSTWTPVSASGSALAAVAFANATTAVAGGANGALLRSTDAGATWTTLASPTTAQVASIAFATNGVGIAGTASGLLRSVDGGATWANVAGVADAINGVAFASTTTAVAVSAGGQVYRSTNGGASWSLVTSHTGSLDAVAAASATTLVAVGPDNAGGSVVLRSVDGGATWQDLSQGVFRNSLDAVAFASATNGVAVGGNGALWRTSDGGATWTDDAPVDDTYLRGVAILQGHAIAVGWYGVILRSDAI